MSVGDVTPLRNPDDAFRTTVESTLGTADETVDILRERVILAMRYTFSWADAISLPGGGLVDALIGPASVVLNAEDLQQAAALKGRVSQMQNALRELLAMMPPDSKFPGKAAVAAYELTSAKFAQLYRDLATSPATLAQRPLLDQVGDLASAVFNAPAAAVVAVAEQTSNAIARALGGTVAAVWSALWPWLLVAGAGGLLYVFRLPLQRAVGKVTQ